MKTIGIVPARGGSKGVPRKNIALLNGKPLIAYTLEAAALSSLERVIVSTEDDEIAAISESLGAEVIRRPHLAGDTAPTLPTLQDALQRAGGSYDAVMTLQPTSPFRTSRHIDEALGSFALHPEADSLVSVVQVPHNMIPQSLMELGADGMLSNHIKAGNLPLRRQDKPVYFARNGAAIYITRVSRLGEYVFGGNILPYLMKKTESFDIDDMEDWVIAERLLRGG